MIVKLKENLCRGSALFHFWHLASAGHAAKDGSFFDNFGVVWHSCRENAKKAVIAGGTDTNLGQWDGTEPPFNGEKQKSDRKAGL